MAAQPDRPILIRLSARQAEQAVFLEGLETWLQLGILTQEQVKQLCQEHLTCNVSPTIAADPSIREAQPLPPRGEVLQPEFTAEDSENSRVLEEAPSPSVSSPVRPRRFAFPFLQFQRSPRSSNPPLNISTRLERWFQAFMAEISVIWLLFLGVFLVVVSSGVLAASQWQNFSPIGQYSILFAYTVAFFAAGFWTGRKENLRLTARMLQLTTLLIIPINFWMMDGLRLWQTPIGVVAGAIAAFLLTQLLVLLFRTNPTLIPRSSLKFATLNYIALCWLHWGWAISPLPLIAPYLGTGGTAALLFLQPSTPSVTLLSIATLLLIGRATLLAQVPIAQLGLALGLCGWIFCWIARPRIGQQARQQARQQNATLQEENPDALTDTVLGARRDRTLWNLAGIGLLGFGWLVSVPESPPLQAFAVSGLGVWLLFDRLRSNHRSSTLAALLLVGLQAYTLLWRILPISLQQALIATATTLLGNASMPLVLLGLAFFPYLWFALALAAWFRPAISATSSPAPSPSVSDPFYLARQAEWFALVLGIAMTLISLLNPAVRSLNLLLSALTLGWTIRHRIHHQAIVPPKLIYSTHGIAVAALLSGVDWRFPNLSSIHWARSLIVILAAEWLLSVMLTLHLRNIQPPALNVLWRKSAWHIGLGLAGLSYTLLIPMTLGNISPAASLQNLVWLTVPVLLMVLSRMPRFFAIPLAAWFSTGALCLHFFLIGTLNSWIISLTIAVGLMVMNTDTLRQSFAAILTIGFALALEAALIWRFWAEQITSAQVLVVLACTLWALWLGRGRLQRSTELLTLYSKAIDGWATLIGAGLLMFMPLLSLTTFSLNELPVTALLAAGLTIGAIAYRLWQQPTELGFYGLAGAIEALLIMLVVRMGGTGEDWAIGNLGLGLLVQLAADIWVNQTPQHQTRQNQTRQNQTRQNQTRQNQTRSPYRLSWHSIPLIYAILGFTAAHFSFTATTGLYTLVAALIGIGVGKRSPQLRIFTVLSLLMGSIAAYELLIYQLIQAESSPGEGFVFIAGLVALIAWLYRLLSRWLLAYLCLTPAQLHPIAHLHWGLGSLLALTALFITLSPSNTVRLLSIALLLTAYALSLGRVSTLAEPSPSSERWTYAGITQALFTIAYGLYEASPNKPVLFAWAGAIASGIATAMYLLPWQQWGWSNRPWRNTSALFPILIIGLTAITTAIQSLLITAAFYGGYAKATHQIRLSYLSVGLVDWAILRMIHEQGWLNALWFSLVMGGSLLYVAQIDPALQVQTAREQRHILRSLATGLVCLTALYQAEVDTGGTAIGVGFATLGLSIALIFAGLFLRVRAYLYIGTVTFVLRILRWLWLFINTYSLLLWAVGIVLGMIFIWIAATFEARRNQVNAIVEYWSTELEQWE